jgi:hypothetical protein
MGLSRERLESAEKNNNSKIINNKTLPVKKKNKKLNS